MHMLPPERIETIKNIILQRSWLEKYFKLSIAKIIDQKERFLKIKANLISAIEVDICFSQGKYRVL